METQGDTQQANPPRPIGTWVQTDVGKWGSAPTQERR